MWFVIALFTAVLPILWPIGLYILFKLYREYPQDIAAASEEFVLFDEPIGLLRRRRRPD